MPPQTLRIELGDARNGNLQLNQDTRNTNVPREIVHTYPEFQQTDDKKEEGDNIRVYNDITPVPTVTSVNSQESNPPANSNDTYLEMLPTLENDRSEVASHQYDSNIPIIEKNIEK